MLFYTVRTTAPWHKAANIPCQDDCSITPSVDNSYMIAAVADGLGSELFTDVASHLAVETVTAYCADKISEKSTEVEILSTMKDAFIAAYKAIVDRAKTDGNDIDEYDTTLCLGVFRRADGQLFFGQSGDSGIVVLNEDGTYQKITSEQQNEDGDVQPLCFGPDYWVFDKVNGVAAVAIMSDGLLKLACPRSLKDQPCTINVYFIENFLQRNNVTAEDIPSLVTEITTYVDNIPDYNSDDDKTIVCVFREGVKVQNKEPEYYSPLDWKALRQSQRQMNSEVLGQYKDDVLSAQADNSKEPSDAVSDARNNEDNESSSIEEPEEKPPPQKVPFAISQTHLQIGTVKISRKTLDFLILGMIAVFSITIWLLRDFLSKNLPVSYLSLLILCFLANATVLLPAGSILVVLEYATMLQSPLSAAVVGGLGASLGELVGYYFGAYSSHAFHWTLFKKLESAFPKHPIFWVALFSFLPLPIFDIIGIWAGTVGMKKRSFFLSCFCGKTAKMLFFVAAWNMVSKYI